MTYDPDRTQVLPEVPSDFPITDELPVVRRGQQSSLGFLLKLVGGLVLVGIAVITAIVVIADQRRSNDIVTSDATPGAITDDDPDSTPGESSTTEPLPRGREGFWRVTGVPDGLNIRAEPGTQSAIIGALVADQRHVFGTGERADVNGSEWKQITFGDDDRTGWVSARFLVEDSAPDSTAPTSAPAVSGETSVVCFLGQDPVERRARIEFTNRTQLSGLLQTTGADSTVEQSVSGTLTNGQASVVLTNTTTGQAVTQDWTFRPARIDLGDGTAIAVTDCSAIADSF